MKAEKCLSTEINRALANDLDASRRIIAVLSRERDTLRGQVQRLRRGMTDNEYVKFLVPRLGREGLLRDIQSVKDLAQMAEERLRALEVRPMLFFSPHPRDRG